MFSNFCLCDSLSPIQLSRGKWASGCVVLSCLLGLNHNIVSLSVSVSCAGKSKTGHNTLDVVSLNTCIIKKDCFPGSADYTSTTLDQDVVDSFCCMCALLTYLIGPPESSDSFPSFYLTNTLHGVIN